MSPYWVCVVLRGGVETRSHVCMKQIFSNVFFPVTQNWISPIPQMHWIWRTGLAEQQREVSFTCESVQLLVADLFRCVSRPGTFTWFFSVRQMLFITAFKIFGVGGLGGSRNHLPAEVPVSWTSRFVGWFKHVPFPQRRVWGEHFLLSSVSFWRAWLAITHRSSWLEAVLLSCIGVTHHTRLLQLLRCNQRGLRPGLPCRTRHRAYRPIPTREKHV